MFKNRAIWKGYLHKTTLPSNSCRQGKPDIFISFTLQHGKHILFPFFREDKQVVSIVNSSIQCKPDLGYTELKVMQQ